MIATSTSAALEHEIGANGLLSVRLRDGSVHLRAVDGHVVRVYDAEGVLSTAFDIERGAGSLALRSGIGRSPDLVIEVPLRASVVVESGSGDLQADGLLGDQRFRTASGDVTLRAVGGAVAVEGVSGDVEVTAVEDSTISVRTVSGDLAIRAATIETLRASTTSGDLRIAGHLAGPGPFSIETVSGDTLLAIAGDVRIEMQTVAGDIRSEIEARTEGGRGRRVMTIGNGGPTLNVRSMSGDVRVVRASAVHRPDVDVDVVPDAPMIPLAPPAPEAPAAPAEPLASRTDAPPAPAATDAAAPDDPAEEARLDILRSLERGEIDVAEAGRRLEALDDLPAGEATDA